MTEMVSGPGPKKLILGFDAGCFTCSDLARRIEERVGEKLEIRNLRDPEVEGWRREALGADAKWVPTLFELEGGKVKAWAGWRMGLALSRKIGPAETWQVMQALGEVGAAAKVEAKIGESAAIERLPNSAAEAMTAMSRKRFLKGVGGAAVAMSILSSGALFPSMAEAATPVSNGTLAQQRRARWIVSQSQQFKSLVAQQAQVGASFNLNNADIKVMSDTTGSYAAIATYSKHPKVSVVAAFFVHLTRGKILYYKHVIMGNTLEPGGKVKTALTKYDNGRPAKVYYRTIFGDDYVIVDNRRMSPKQFKNLLAAQARQASTTPPSGGPINAMETQICPNQPTVQHVCEAITTYGCHGLGEIVDPEHISGAIGSIFGFGQGIGGAVDNACSSYFDYVENHYSAGCASAGRMGCSDEYYQPPPSVYPTSPSGYCP